MVVVGIDLGTQSLKAVVCDETLAVLGAHAISYPTHIRQPGWAEQDAQHWERALAPAIAGALADAGRAPADVAALALAGQLDGCVPVDASGSPIYTALIWQDRRASQHVVSPPGLHARTGQIADASHMAAKIGWLRARGLHAARYHQPVSYLVERLTGEAVLDPGHASTTMLFELASGAWSPELLAAFAIDASELPAIRAATEMAGVLTARGAALTGLPAGIPVAVGTGDDFATPLGAGIAAPGPVVCSLGTAEVVGTVSAQPVLDVPGARAARDPWRDLAEPMVETHAYPTGAFFVENPGWLSGGAVRWASQLLGCASDAELDALAAAAPAGAGGLVFVPALSGAMTPRWQAHARGTLHGLSAAHDRGHIARAVLEGLAFACRDVVTRLDALGLPTQEIVVLGGGGHSTVWLQIRADVLGRSHRVARRSDTCAIGAAMLALVAIRHMPDLATAAGCVPPPASTVAPRGGVVSEAHEAAYRRYRRLVAQLGPLGDHPWA